MQKLALTPEQMSNVAGQMSDMIESNEWLEKHSYADGELTFEDDIADKVLACEPSKPKAKSPRVVAMVRLAELHPGKSLEEIVCELCEA